MGGAHRHWPEHLVAYKRTPEFTEATVPQGLLRRHSTKDGVWGRIHVLSGRLLFTDLLDGTQHVLDAGVHAVVFPKAEHEVAPDGDVRFFVEFLARP